MIKASGFFGTFLVVLTTYASCPEPSFIWEHREALKKALGSPDRLMTLNQKIWQVETLFSSHLLQKGYTFDVTFEERTANRGREMCFYKLDLQNSLEDTLLLTEEPFFTASKEEKRETKNFAISQEDLFIFKDENPLSQDLEISSESPFKVLFLKDREKQKAYSKSLDYGEHQLVQRYFALLDILQEKIPSLLTLEEVCFKINAFLKEEVNSCIFPPPSPQFFFHVQETMGYLQKDSSFLNVEEDINMKAQDLVQSIGTYLESHIHHELYKQGWSQLILTLKDISKTSQGSFASIDAFVSLGESLLKLFKE